MEQSNCYATSVIDQADLKTSSSHYACRNKREREKKERERERELKRGRK